MKKLLLAFVVITSCSTFVHAWNPPDNSSIMTSNSRTVSVSTISSSYTLLLNKDSFIQQNLIINLSTCTVFLSSTTTGITTSSFGIPPSSTSYLSQFSPDGVNSPWGGALYGLSNCAGTSSSQVTIFRSK